jgi:hypothetical protein
VKTLAELVGESLDMQATHTEQVARFVGAVREWLSQQRTLDTANRDVTGTFDELIFEAGRGLDA